MVLDSANTLTVYGALNTSGNIGTASITCLNINTQGYNVTTGTLNVSGAGYFGAIHNYGNIWSATGTIGNVDFKGEGAAQFPNVRATTGAHMVLNGAAIYLNLDIPGNSILVYGPMTCYHPLIIGSSFYPNTNGTLDMGWAGNKFRTAYLNLPAAPAGAVYVMTGADGALSYMGSSRKLKKNLRPYDLERSSKILDLSPSYYQHLASEGEKDYLIGLMTDEIPSELDDLVVRFTREGAQGPEEIEAIHYDRMTMHLLVVMKNMQRRIDQLEARTKEN
jgi:hypothetical protein